jgi:hypothetical protein
MMALFADNDNSTPYAIRRRWGKILCKCGSVDFTLVESKMNDRIRLNCNKCGQCYQVVK